MPYLMNERSQSWSYFVHRQKVEFHCVQQNPHQILLVVYHPTPRDTEGKPGHQKRLHRQYHPLKARPSRIG